MLSKMAQPNNVGGGSGSAAAGGRRVPLSLSGVAVSGTTVSRLQQAATGNGRSKSPQNSNVSKKGEHPSGPFIAIKKGSANQQRSSTASSASSSSSVSSKPHDDEKKKGQNGVNKSTNGNQKVPQNNGGTSAAAAVVQEQKQQQTKEKVQEKKEALRTELKAEEKPSKKESETETKQVESKKNKTIVSEVIDLDEEPQMDEAPPTTPTSERKSARRSASAAATNSPVSAPAPAAITPKKTPNKAEAAAEQHNESPSQRKQQHNKAEAEQQSEKEMESDVARKEEEEKSTTTDDAPVEDVEMEALTVDASPIRRTMQQQNNAQPAATSTPGRNLFGFRSNSKQVNEVELAAQLSNSPASAPPARTFAQISGRRSIRPTTGLTPGKMGSYRCVNTSELDTSGLTNTSMNATVGSEIPNSSSFSFSFFGRGRKRERTPPPLSASQSANDLAQDVEMSPPKRARFELFSLNLASPFSLLRSRFSRATINSPSSRQRLDLTPPNGEEGEEVGEVQNVSGVVNQEEEELNKSSSVSNELNEVALEAGLETPKKAGTPENEVVVEDDVDKKDKVEGGKDIDDAVAAADNLPTTDAAEAVEESSSYGDGTNRSRCAIM